MRVMPSDPAWTYRSTSLGADDLVRDNALFGVSSGYLGLSGHILEHRDGPCPVTLINGVFDEVDLFGTLRATSEPPAQLDARYFDTAGATPAIANLPNPQYLRIFVDDREITLARGGLRDLERTLDLATGLSHYRYDFRDAWNRMTRIQVERFAAIAHPHRVYQRITITPLDHDAELRLRIGIDGSTFSNITRERCYRVVDLSTHPAERCRMGVHLPARSINVDLACAHRLIADEADTSTSGVTEHDAVYTQFTRRAARDQPVTIEKHIVLTSSEDLRHGVVANIDDELNAALEQGFDTALAEQSQQWSALWHDCDVRIDGASDAQLAVRFTIHHLLAAAPRYNNRLAMPNRLLTSDAGGGHTRYEHELFILPLLTLTQSQIARASLAWRSAGLRPARETARSLGYAGAKLAWHAGPAGEECLGPWQRLTRAGIHVNADVCYALMQYLCATDDRRFLQEHGLELLIESARFYAARAEPGTTPGTYDFTMVFGPDESPDADGRSWYTNAMVRWLLLTAAEAATAVEAARSRPPSVVTRDEINNWRSIAGGLVRHAEDDATQHVRRSDSPVPSHPAVSDILAPFLQRASRDADLRLAAALLPNDSDLLNALPDSPASADTRTDLIAQVLTAARHHDRARTHAAFQRLLRLSLDAPRETANGLDAAALGGVWFACIFGFAGVCVDANGLHIDPCLPEGWSGLHFTLKLRGVSIGVAVTPMEVTIRAGIQRKLELPVTVTGNEFVLHAGEERNVVVEAAN